MIQKWFVRPARAELNLVHPSGEALPAGGAMWPADQFTFRRIRDGDIVKGQQVPETAVPTAAAAALPTAAAAPELTAQPMKREDNDADQFNRNELPKPANEFSGRVGNRAQVAPTVTVGKTPIK